MMLSARSMLHPLSFPTGAEGKKTFPPYLVCRALFFTRKPAFLRIWGRRAFFSLPFAPQGYSGPWKLNFLFSVIFPLLLITISPRQSSPMYPGWQLQ